MIRPFVVACALPRRISALGACASLSLLAACASLPSPPATQLALPAAALAPLEDYDWHFEHQTQTAQLAYGVAHSDDIPFGLSCHTGSGQIQMTTPTLDPKLKTITLGTSEASQTYTARQEAAEMFDGYLLHARTTPDDPVLISFAKLGWLVIAHENSWAGLSPQSGTKTPGKDFLAACR